VAIAPVSLTCTIVIAVPVCNERTAGGVILNDIIVADQVTAGDAGDDQVVILQDDGTGLYSVAGAAATQGDPTLVLAGVNQPTCPQPLGWTNPLRHDSDGRTTVIAVLQPATESVGIYLPSNSGLIPPVARPEPLPVPGTPVHALFASLNNDAYQDLVVLSAGDGDPATPNVTVYIGIGNGLFFTDPTLNPAGIDDGAALLASGNLDLRDDATYPEIVVHGGSYASPVVLKNVITERADIDGSGRVDGFDLALLSRAFGATRGEDFTILGPAAGPLLDGTLLQSGSGPGRVVVGSGSLPPGQDVPDSAALCDGALDATSSYYGLPVDINLDGDVDGEDLSLLAMRFGGLP
jgi:hypothetical protein